MKKRIMFHPLKAMGNLVVYVFALILTVPLFFAFLTSFKTEQERVLNPIGLPINFTLENFKIAWLEGGLLQASMNSIVVCCCSTLLLILNIIIVSYALNRIRDTKVGIAFYLLTLSTLFIPGVGTINGLMLRRSLGLYNNLWGEIFCGAVSIATGVFLVSGTLRTIPRDLEEAAMLDGASDIQICFRVIAPVVRPTIVSVAILEFTTRWNDALGPLLTLRNQNLYTLPMALYLNFTNQTSVEYTTLFAGVLMTATPLIIAYFTCQKYFVSALAGSVKG